MDRRGFGRTTKIILHSFFSFVDYYVNLLSSSIKLARASIPCHVCYTKKNVWNTSLLLRFEQGEIDLTLLTKSRVGHELDVISINKFCSGGKRVTGEVRGFVRKYEGRPRPSCTISHEASYKLFISTSSLLRDSGKFGITKMKFSRIAN